DPTNGYYNVRASTHDEGRPASRSMHYSDYRTSGQPGGAAAVVSSSSGAPGATAGPGTPSSLAPGSRAGCYDPRPPSRLSHNSYAQFNTFTRAGHSGPQTSDFTAECSLLDSTGQLGYENYGYPHYPTFRMGFGPPSLAPCTERNRNPRDWTWEIRQFHTVLLHLPAFRLFPPTHTEDADTCVREKRHV
ncbi:hypothetical protein M9458_016510, partial [Cirrhinus mrigala]